MTSLSNKFQDSLVSDPAWLSVQVPPSQIDIMLGDKEMTEMITVTESKMSVVSCVTRFSNPAPTISWKLGDTILPSYNQTDKAEVTAANKVRSESWLKQEFSQENTGELLSCVVTHPAYTDQSHQAAVHATLDVLCESLYNHYLQIRAIIPGIM